MKAALLYLFSASAWAQTLTPVTAPAGSGIPWWTWPVVGVVIVIAGFVWLKFKSPATAAKVQATASADVAALTAAIGKLLEHGPASAHTSPTGETTITVPTVPDLQPQLDAANGKLAQIKAILEA